MCAPTATPSTPASRRSSTPVAAWPGSRPATPRRPRRTRLPRAASSASTTPAPAPRGRRRSFLSAPPREAPVFEAVATLVDEHADLESQLSRPETHADARLAKRLNQRYAELTAIVTTWRKWRRAGDDIAAAHELAVEDPAFAEEVTALTSTRDTAEERLRRLL